MPLTQLQWQTYVVLGVMLVAHIVCYIVMRSLILEQHR